MKSHKSFCFLVLCICFLLAMCIPGSAQGLYYPTFDTGTKVTSFQMNYSSTNTWEIDSPAIIYDPATGTLWAAFYDKNNSPYLSVASSTDGVNFTVHTTSVSGDSAPTWGIFNGVIYLSISQGSPYINIYSLNTSTGALSLTQTFNTGSIGDHLRRQALAEFNDGSNDCFYIAWNGNAWDPGSGTEDGQWAHVASSCFWPTTGFSTPAYNDPPVSSSYPAGTGMAFNVYAGQLYLTYSDSSTGYPQMFGKTSLSGSWSDLTGSGGGHGVYGGDPAAMTYDGVVYVMYRSAYSDDELWCIGTTDGYSFGPSYEYGQTMKFSPYLTINSSTSRFYQSEFTDHPSSGSYMWLYSGDSATTNPY